MKTRPAFTIGPLNAEAGQRTDGWLEITRRADGSPVAFPLTVFHGREDGPVLLIDGCTHGDEVDSAMAVHRIVGSVDPAKLRGTLIAVPVVNVLALDSLQRTTPTHLIGNPDINRVYPGKPGGTLTERMAHMYLSEVISRAQYMITIHSGGLYYMEPPKVIFDDDGDDVGKKAREMAKAFGWEIIWKNPGYVGTSAEAAKRRGIAVICPELGGSDRMPERLESYIGRFAEGALNVMRHLGMLEEPAKSRGKWLECSGDSHVHASRDGFIHLEPGVTLEARVAKGQKLASIQDIFGREVERISAPWDGAIILLRTYAFVHAGDWVLSVGEKSREVTA